MERRPLARHVVAVGLALSLAAAVPLLDPQTAVSAERQEIVIPGAERATPREDAVLSVGAAGFLHDPEAVSGWSWTDFTGKTTVVPEGGTQAAGRSSDVIARLVTAERSVELTDMADGRKWQIALPVGQEYVGTFGEAVVTRIPVAGSAGAAFASALHVLRKQSDGSVSDLPFTGLPAGAQLWVTTTLSNADGVMASAQDSSGVITVYWLDLDSGRAVPAPPREPAGVPHRWAVTADRLLVWSPAGVVRVYATRDMSLLESVAVPYGENTRLIGAVGRSLLVGRYEPVDGSAPSADKMVHRVVAIPFDGGAEQQLLASAGARPFFSTAGTVLMAAGGGSAAAAWSVGADDSGAVTLRKIVDVPPVVSTTKRLDLSHGRLVAVESTVGVSQPVLRTGEVSETDPLVHSGTRTGFYATHWCDDGSCRGVVQTGDGRRIVTEAPDRISVSGSPSVTSLHAPDLREDVVLAAAGRFVLLRGLDSIGAEKLQVVDLDRESRSAYLGPMTAAALHGRLLWLPGSTAGTVVARDLHTGTVVKTVKTTTGCTPKKLLASAERLYWDCNGFGHGLVDLTRGTQSVPNRTLVALTDTVAVGYGGRGLEVSDVRSGVTVPLFDVAVSYPQEPGAWSLDPTGRALAYRDLAGLTRVVTPGIAAPPLRALDESVPDRARVSGYPTGPWLAAWWPSKPVASWKLELRHKISGKVVRTFTGGSTRDALRVSWNGKDPAGDWVPNGVYTWALSAVPADGSGAALSRTGSMTMFGAGSVVRDYSGVYTSVTSGPDGTADLITLNSKGGMTIHHGTGTGVFAGKASNDGWSTTTVAAPMGDLNGDRCNDLLVRMPNGDARVYQRHHCGAAFHPSNPYVRVGTGWGAYNAITSPGDITSDGVPDLITRRASTGEVYLYASNGTGGFKAKVVIRTGWSGYKKLIGAGDITGDGIGDLLAWDNAGSLWRYDGTGTGRLKDRVLVFSNWGKGYTAIVGVGDITGDGKADLVERDSAGVLWRNTGNGKGSFSSRTQIGTGFTYVGVF